MSQQKKQLFILDPLQDLDLKLDSSLQMAQALKNAEVSVYFTTVDQLYWDSRQSGASCRAYELQLSSGLWQAGGADTSELKEFQVIHMRKDPPFDMRYVATTWLLESAAKECKIINSPGGLRKYNEKIAAHYFPDYAIPSLISSDLKTLVAYFKNECRGNAVLKPLDLYGGRGVEHLTLESHSITQVEATILNHLKDGQLRQIQPFQKQVAEGEVRAFVSFGEPISWCLKVPKAGGFLANTRAGATLHKYQPKPADIHMVSEISSKLRKDGIEWVGFDLIGGRVSEINITSPRILCADPNDYEKCFEKMAKQILNSIEN